MARYKSGNIAKDRRNVPCGGWKNWDTWQVNVIIGNDRKCYDYVRSNKRALLMMNKYAKLDAIDRHSTYGLRRSGIVYSNVDFKELNDIIRELP